VSWVTLATAPGPTNQFEFTDVLGQGVTQRFYRAAP